MNIDGHTKFLTTIIISKSFIFFNGIKPFYRGLHEPSTTLASTPKLQSSSFAAVACHYISPRGPEPH